MKLWLDILCEKHGEAITFFVSNPSCTAHYLSEHDKEIQAWLEEHTPCGCRVIATDPQMDELWDQGWKIDFSSKIRKMYKPTGEKS